MTRKISLGSVPESPMFLVPKSKLNANGYSALEMATLTVKTKMETPISQTKKRRSETPLLAGNTMVLMNGKTAQKTDTKNRHTHSNTTPAVLNKSLT